MITLDELYEENFDEAFDLTGGALPIAGIRRDAETSPVDADGDAHPLVFDDAGRLKVATLVSVEPSDAEYAEDSAHTSGDVGLQILAVRQDTLASSVDTDGDYGSLKLDSLGRLYTTTVIEGGVNDFYDTAMKRDQQDVGTTAVEITATPLANRKQITIQNEGSKSVYLGEDNTVTSTGATAGIKISRNSSATFNIGPNIDLFLISESGTQDIRILELA